MRRSHVNVSVYNPPINFRGILLATLLHLVQITEPISRNNSRLRRYLSFDYFRRKERKPAEKGQLESFNFSSLLLTWKKNKFVL